MTRPPTAGLPYIGKIYGRKVDGVGRLAPLVDPRHWATYDFAGTIRQDARDGTVQITVNGQAREFPEKTSVRALLDSLDVKTKAVAVERNLEIVPRSQHAECLLSDGDRLEIVTLVGGG